MRPHHFLFTALVSGSLAACATTDTPERSWDETALGYSAWVANAQSGLSRNAVDRAWWERVGDPKLAELIERAHENEPGLRQALARIEEARALSRISESAGGPNVIANANASRARQSENAGGPAGAIPSIPLEQDQVSANLSVGWEVDLFGRLARREDAAAARFNAQRFDYQAASLALSAEIGLTYVNYRTAQRALELQRANELLAERTLDLTQARVDAGADGEQALRTAQAALETVRADRPGIVARQRVHRAALAVLVGLMPNEVERLALGDFEGPVAATPIPLGLASTLVSRRPDIQAARLRLEAADADAAAERADRYPVFSLTGALGGAAMSFDDLVTSGSETWSVGAGVNWPIFQAGRLQAEIDAADARVAGAEAAYEGVVLNAFKEVETALANYAGLVEEGARVETALARQARALELAQLQYEAGAISLLPLLDAQRQVLALRNRQEGVVAARLRAQVNLYRALGGGWHAHTPVAQSADREPSTDFAR